MATTMDAPDLSAVGLFSLPNVVLFPGAVLPLHIFEERYKAMIAQALRGNRKIAMALLQPGWERNYHGKPAIRPVVCVGTILTHERLSDGCYNLLLQGHTRATVVRECGGQQFRMAHLRPLEERPVMEIDLAEPRRRIGELFESHKLRETGIARRFRQLLCSPICTSQIADLVCFYFLEDLQLKQQFLEDPDVRHRVEGIVDAFEALHASLEPACGSYVHSCDASLN